MAFKTALFERAGGGEPAHHIPENQAITLPWDEAQTNMTDLHKSKPFLWAIFVIFTLLWFFVLDIRALDPPDEGRYAEIAREILHSGDWITTRLNGIKYFEKPPLQMWMTALAFKFLGLGEWQARLWGALSSYVGVVLLGYTGRTLFNERVGFFAALVLASSIFWAGASQFSSLDIGLSGMLTVVLCGLLLAQRETVAQNARRNWMLVSWAAMALAVLSKGPIGMILPGAVLVIYTALSRDWGIWLRLHLGKGLLLFFAIAAPWFVLVSQKNPEFAHFFFIYEHVERFLSKSHHREGPWYYFIVLLMPGILPWLGLLPQSLLQGFRGEPSCVFKPKLMLLVWVAFIFFFFSYSNSKLPGYILPIYPALALLIALQLEAASRTSRIIAGGVVAVVGLVGLAFAPRIANLSADPLTAASYQTLQAWVMAACVIAMAGGVLSAVCARHQKRDAGVLTLALTGLVSVQLVLAGLHAYENYRSGLHLVAAVKPELAPHTKLYSVGMYDYSLTFYLQRTSTLVEYTDEFIFGLTQEPHLSIQDREKFLEKWRHDASAVAILRPDIFKQFQERAIPMRVVASDGLRVLVSNTLSR